MTVKKKCPLQNFDSDDIITSFTDMLCINDDNREYYLNMWMSLIVLYDDKMNDCSFIWIFPMNMKIFM